jgi:hypothetical protein
MFFLLTKLKSDLKGFHFETFESIQNNVMTVLKGILFQALFSGMTDLFISVYKSGG